MNRRGFLSLLGMAAGGVLLDQAIPFNRVWSFPKEIVIPTGNVFLSAEWISMETLRILKDNIELASMFNQEWEREFADDYAFAVRSSWPIRTPQRFDALFGSRDLSFPPEQFGQMWGIEHAD